MARRTAGDFKVYLYPPGGRYAMQYSGFGWKVKAVDLYKQKRDIYTTFDSSAYKLVGLDPHLPLTAQPAACYIELPDNLGGYTSVPYLDASQDVGLSCWTTTNGKWEELEDPEYTADTWVADIGHIVQNRDATEQVTVQALSKFHMPAEPLIAIHLWRGEPTKDQDRVTYPAYTQVTFGAGQGQYSLVMPYGGEAAYLCYWSGTANGWQRLDADHGGKLPSLEGMGKGQRALLVIACWHGRICIGFGKGKGAEASWTMFKRPAEQPFVSAGPIHIQHNAGQIAFRWWPIWMYSTTDTVLTDAQSFASSYALWKSVSPWTSWIANPDLPTEVQVSASQCDKWRSLLWHQLPAPPGGALSPPTALTGAQDITVTPFCPTGLTQDPLNPGHEWFSGEVSWKASWRPQEWSLSLTGSMDTGHHASYTLFTFNSPMLYGVQVRSTPHVVDYGVWPTATDVSGYVQALSVDIPEGSKVAQAGLKLKNNAGPFASAKSGQFVMIQLGYRYADGTTDLTDSPPPVVFTGYIATVGVKAQVGPLENCDVVCHGPAIRLRDEKADTVPDMAVFSPKTAVSWLATRAGFDPTTQQNLLGTTTLMGLGPRSFDDNDATSFGDATCDALRPAFGSELAASVDEYCRRDLESEWWVRPDYAKGFVLEKMANQWAVGDGTLWTVNENADASSATEFTIYDLQKDAIPMDADEYADLVLIRGRTTEGWDFEVSDADFSRLTDPANADYTGGWRKMHVEARDHLQTAADARAYCIQKLTKLKRRCIIARLTTDIVKGMVHGDRVYITSAAASGRVHNAGLRNMTFRATVRGYVYDRNSLPRMTLQLRSLEVA